MSTAATATAAAAGGEEDFQHNSHTTTTLKSVQSFRKKPHPPSSHAVHQGTLAMSQEHIRHMESLVRDLQCGKCNKALLMDTMMEVSAFLEGILLKRVSFSTVADEEDFLSEAAESDIPNNVHEWLTSTFTRHNSLVVAPKKRLRSLVNAMRMSIVFDRIYRRMSQATDLMIPPKALFFLKENLSQWSFDVFEFDRVCNEQALKVISYELLFKTNFVSQYSMNAGVIENFISRVQEGYERYENPYHNVLHAVDVMQTCNYLIAESPLTKGISELEMFAVIFAAMIHDYEHTGTTNLFHVKTDSELALLYNDKSVLENYHISAIFRLMREPECNVLATFSRAEYVEFRNLVIPLVLATDMSNHFTLVQNMKDAILLPDLMNKNDIFAYLLHCADISHPTKAWDLHYHWSQLVVEEFFKQGDREKELGLPCSPLCDRAVVLVPDSQIGFINFIVDPGFTVLGHMLESIGPLFNPEQKKPAAQIQDDDDEPMATDEEETPKKIYPWAELIEENRNKWNEQKKAQSLSVITEERESFSSND